MVALAETGGLTAQQSGTGIKADPERDEKWTTFTLHLDPQSRLLPLFK